MPEISLHLAADAIALWERLAASDDLPELCFPYWAVAWAGGQAVSRFLLDNPSRVTGRNVLDFGAGSGVCGIAAVKAGAATVVCAEVDPLARAATCANAKINDVSLSISDVGIGSRAVDEFDLVVAGDVCYEREMTARVLPWLRRYAERGVEVLLGDPGREYFPRAGMRLLATFEVPTPRDVEGVTAKRTGVYQLEQ